MTELLCSQCSQGRWPRPNTQQWPEPAWGNVQDGGRSRKERGSAAGSCQSAFAPQPSIYAPLHALTPTMAWVCEERSPCLKVWPWKPGPRWLPTDTLKWGLNPSQGAEIGGSVLGKQESLSKRNQLCFDQLGEHTSQAMALSQQHPYWAESSTSAQASFLRCWKHLSMCLWHLLPDTSLHHLLPFS